jgi:hypothetical protein
LKIDQLLIHFLQSVDIAGASYFSDGRFLNTSIWLYDDRNETFGYLLSIDSDSNPKTGEHEADYQLQMTWNSQNQTWNRELVESISYSDRFNNKAIIDKEEIHGKLTFPIQLDFDLKDINYPASYILVFYAQTEGTYEDSTTGFLFHHQGYLFLHQKTLLN